MPATTTDALTDFLRARIAEEEADARYAVGNDWRPDEVGCCVVDPEEGTVAERTWDSSAHIARWNPSRVFAECKAKKWVIAECTPLAGNDPGLSRWVLKLLAQPYAEHADYRDEWRP